MTKSGQIMKVEIITPTDSVDVTKHVKGGYILSERGFEDIVIAPLLKRLWWSFRNSIRSYFLNGTGKGKPKGVIGKGDIQ